MTQIWTYVDYEDAKTSLETILVTEDNKSGNFAYVDLEYTYSIKNENLHFHSVAESRKVNTKFFTDFEKKLASNLWACKENDIKWDWWK